ncbi:MAG: SURF1 family protein [Sinobacteraceae bacterium]|nr:SURF1 family protein [Nevskiaceae bacterium]
MNSEPSTDTSAPQAHSTVHLVAVAAFGLFVFIVLIGLGSWQIHRWQYKLDVVAQIQQRAHTAPVAPPGVAAWPRITAQRDQYRRLQLHGHFIAGKTTFVHGSSKLGYGFWLMSPFQTHRGFIVLVNRGYVPAGKNDQPRYDPPAASGSHSITGLLRISEPGGGFLRPNHPAQNRWYSRDVAAIAQAEGLNLKHVAPYFVDAVARPHQGRWPVAGLTPLNIYNHSLGYAITWYSLALLSLLGAGIVARHEWRLRQG